MLYCISNIVFKEKFKTNILNLHMNVSLKIEMQINLRKCLNKSRYNQFLFLSLQFIIFLISEKTDELTAFPMSCD